VNDRRSAEDLAEIAEALLTDFPFPDRDWEASARIIEGRLSDTKPGRPTDASLFAPPQLSAEPGEPAAATATPLTHSGVRTQSLAEIARRSVEKQAEERAELARASLVIAAQQRPATEANLATQAAPEAAVAVAAQPAAASQVRSVNAALAVAAVPALQPAGASRASLGFFLAGVVALAAGALLWLRHPAEPTPLITTQTVAVASPAHPSAPIAAAAQAADEPRGPQAIDPNTLAREGESTAKAPSSAGPGKAVAIAAPAVAAQAGAAAPRAATGAEPIVLEDEAPSAPVAAAPDAAEDKPKQPPAALPPDPALHPADSSSGGALPTKPSTGAVQAALGAVMSGARHCVAGDTGPSSAVVVFGSDGHVQSVAVGGSAAGKPAAACIQAQLSRARVQPFAAASFSINATVRPD